MRKYDFSEGSKNPYTVGDRHNLIPPCLQCGQTTEVIIDGDKYYRYFIAASDFARDIWPDLTVEQVDMLITGIHPECSDAFYGTEEY